MKSHRPITRKERMELCQAVWGDTEKCINTNGALLVFALRRYTGWGKKKINDFLQICNDVQEEYRGYELDGTFDIEFEKAIDDTGLDIEQLLPKPINFSETMQIRRRERERAAKASHVSRAKAEAMRAKLEQFRDYAGSLKRTELKGDTDNGKT